MIYTIQIYIFCNIYICIQICGIHASCIYILVLEGFCPPGNVHFVIYIFVLDICCQHLGYMLHLEGFYVPFGHKVRECTFCNIYIFVLDICYQQLGEMCQLEGFCVPRNVHLVIYIFALDI